MIAGLVALVGLGWAVVVVLDVVRSEEPDAFGRGSAGGAGSAR